MKKGFTLIEILVCVIIVGTLAAIGFSVFQARPIQAPLKQQNFNSVTKVIKMKTEAVEQRRSGIDLLNERETFALKSVTIYYLVAEDGMVVEVGLTDYARYDQGDEYTSNKWVVK